MLTNEEQGYIQDLKDTVEEVGDDRLNDWERSFIADQFERYEKYGDDTRFSPKQWTIVRKIGALYDLEEAE